MIFHSCFCIIIVFALKIIRVIKLSLIQCDDLCIFQIDGFCSLEHFTTVNSVEKDCPHFKPKTLNQIDGFLKTSNTTKF